MESEARPKTEDLFEAMAFLEECDGSEPHEKTLKMVYAAHYLIQRYALGHKPDNFNEIVGEARAIACT